MAPQPVSVVFGGFRIGNNEPFTPSTRLDEAFKILADHKITTIDSAQVYGISQETIGEVHAGDKFIIDTKWGPPRRPGPPGPPPPGPPKPWASKEYIINSAKESIAKLGVKQVDIFYIHFPDSLTPIEETLAGVNEVYKLGLFRRFGLSNYQAAEVQAVHDHCAEKGYVLPTVYQGPYSPVTRYQEKLLFPTLRNLSIAFYAYSPSAGGFLGKTPEQVVEQAKTNPFRRRYAENPKFLSALTRWNAAAADEGVGGAELAYRWIAYHSPLKKELGDALIVGTSSLEQLEESLSGVEKGPLSEKALAGAEEVWEILKDEPPPSRGPPRPQPAKAS